MTTSLKPSSIVASALALAIMASGLAVESVAADPRDNHDQNVQHANWGPEYQGAPHQWRRGQRIGYNDWAGAQPVDYRAHHLRHPPRGYEWRQSNGQYVLAAVATGVIASIILSGGR